LKRFFRKLSVKIFDYEKDALPIYYVEKVKERPDEEKVALLKTLLNSWKTSGDIVLVSKFKTLKAVFKHLNDIAFLGYNGPQEQKHSYKPPSLMTPNNLAIVWSPNLFEEHITDVFAQMTVPVVTGSLTQIMIEHYPELFKKSAEEIKKMRVQARKSIKMLQQMDVKEPKEEKKVQVQARKSIKILQQMDVKEPKEVKKEEKKLSDSTSSEEPIREKERKQPKEEKKPSNTGKSDGHKESKL